MRIVEASKVGILGRRPSGIGGGKIIAILVQRLDSTVRKVKPEEDEEQERSGQAVVAPGKGIEKRAGSEGETGGWREVKALPRRISSRAPGEIGAACIDLYAQ